MSKPQLAGFSASINGGGGNSSKSLPDVQDHLVMFTSIMTLVPVNGPLVDAAHNKPLK